jgi:hypothetical protein
MFDKIVLANVRNEPVGVIISKTIRVIMVAANDIIQVESNLPLISCFAEIGSIQRLTIDLPSCPIVIVENISGTMNGTNASKNNILDALPALSNDRGGEVGEDDGEEGKD